MLGSTSERKVIRLRDLQVIELLSDFAENAQLEEYLAILGGLGINRRQRF